MNRLEEEKCCSTEVTNVAFRTRKAPENMQTDLTCVIEDKQDTKDANDLDFRISSAKEAFDVTSEDDPEWRHRATVLEDVLWEKYSATGQAFDLGRAFRIAQMLFGTTDQTHTEWRHRSSDAVDVIAERHHATGSITDLGELIQIGRGILDVVKANHPHWARKMAHLGEMIWMRYELANVASDLDESIDSIQQAVDAVQDFTKENPSGWARRLANLSDMLWTRWEATGAANDLDDSIRMLQRAIDTTQDDDPDWSDRSARMADAIWERYKISQAEADLDEYIRVGHKLVAITRDQKNQSEMTPRLRLLGEAIWEKYEISRAAVDLDESIRIMQEAVAATPPDEDRPGWAHQLDFLGDAIYERYQLVSSASDLDDSIRMMREIVHGTLREKDAILWAHRLTVLGDRIWTRYELTASAADLDEFIQIAYQVVDATVQDGTAVEWQSPLTFLGDSVWARYKSKGAVGDLDESIRISQLLVDATDKQENCEEWARQSNFLVTALWERYTTTETDADLQRWVNIAQEVVNVSDKHDPMWAQWLNNLGNALSYRYLATGGVGDLEESIRVFQEVADDINEDSPLYPMSLNNLANVLRYRYDSTGAIALLEEAITRSREAVRLSRKITDPSLQEKLDMVHQLKCLAIGLGNRYHRTEAMCDLEEAIEVSRECLDLIPENHPERIHCLNNYGNRMGDMYGRTKEMTHLEEAIKVAREALDLLPENHPDIPGHLNNLSVGLGDRYYRTWTRQDLDEAIFVTRKALNATPDDHPQRAQRAIILGDRLKDRYEKGKSLVDLDESISLHLLTLELSSSSLLVRILGGREAVKSCAASSDWKRAHVAASKTVALMPKLNSRSLETSDKQYRLGQVVGIACDGAAAALLGGEHPGTALSILEQGRGVLAASLDEVRADTVELRKEHAELADRFIRLQNELEGKATLNASSTTHKQKSSVQAQADRRSVADREFDELLAEIRGYPGFKDFLLPPSAADMQTAAEFGPIVVINVSEYRCDAILIESHQIRSLVLPDLNHRDVWAHAHLKNLGVPEVLEWLWDSVTRPILDALGFTSPVIDGKWPRMWWIATGLMSVLPLHAAGYHRKNSARTVLDRVMSSYSSSIKAIIQGRRRHQLEIGSKELDQVLLISMQDTPNQPRLPFVAREVEVLHDLCNSLSFQPTEVTPRKGEVISHLPNCKMFHFAGHGHTDHADPAQSSLLLADWESDPLTVADLLATNIRDRAPFLAYLSACGTGQIRDEKLLDESIHLISACQIAGFRHVIGSLWEVNDQSCVDIAKITYNEMMHGGLTDESVCLGLHKATRALRDTWVQMPTRARKMRKDTEDATGRTAIQVAPGERGAGAVQQRKIAVFDEEEDVVWPMHWVPYVHFGV
ncbi:tpr domain containing protein [Stemphylium lycopersici]|uniref:Tpr domain containing protein n=1 Tax=Stemphylium lycopersici TaxID=183478 RepID=A0A364MWN9_STELY|nr:tpr domain containing protein [Stemphylium lycopersici]